MRELFEVLKDVDWLYVFLWGVAWVIVLAWALVMVKLLSGIGWNVIFPFLS